MVEERLRTYRSKRRFGETSEPRGEEDREPHRSEAEPPGEVVGQPEAQRREAPLPRFVVQKHDASSLHYDFRLEVDGVLPSWAVPKGPSTDPRDRRLAIRTEDHPLDYLLFEGVIPRGNYGGGTVVVWDTGTYRNLSSSAGRPVPVAQALKAGHVKIWLEGRKLRGGFALTRVPIGGDERKWLLVKVDDAEAAPELDLVRDRPESVLTGRTNNDLRATRAP